MFSVSIFKGMCHVRGNKTPTSVMVSGGFVFCFTPNVLFFATLKRSHTNKDMVHYLYSHDSPVSWPLLEFRHDRTVS